jgi:tape measure domain-containing protein
MATPSGVELATAYVSVIPSLKGSKTTIAKELGAKADPAAERAGKSAGEKFTSGLKTGIGKVGQVLKLGVLAGGAAVAAAGVVGIKTAAEMETANIAFTTMLGSAEEAKKFLGDLSSFAAKTPFDLPGLQRSAQSLVSIGIESDKVIPIMTTLGNVTSGMGTGAEGVQRATTAIQQMNAAGKISAEDLNQLRDAGVPVFDLLTAATGKTTEEIAEMANKGKLGKEELEQLMSALESGKGLEKFNGMMEKQSTSLTGLWSTLQDTFSVGMAEAIQPFIPALKEGLGGAITFIADLLPKVQTGITEFIGGIEAFGASWAYNDGEVTSSGFPGFMERLAYAIRQAVDRAVEFGRWLDENKGTIAAVAAVIGTLLIPVFIRAGVQATISGVKQVAAWAASSGGAIKTAAVYVIQSYKIIGAWVAQGAAAIKSGAQTAAIWLMYRLDAIKAAGVYAAQSARIAAAWAVQSAAAIGSGIKQGAVWTGTMIRSAVTGAATFVVQAARVVGGWALMGVQSLIHAARMAAAWFIALGPIGWITAAVIGIAILVIANWEKIKAFTIAIFTNVANFARDTWANIQKWITGAIEYARAWINQKILWIKAAWHLVWTTVKNKAVEIWTGIRNTITGAIESVRAWIDQKVQWIRAAWALAWGIIRDKATAIWTGIKDSISNVWRLGLKPIWDTIMRVITEDVPDAFRKGVDFVKEIWSGIKAIAKKPISFIIDTVLNKGLIGAYNTVADWLKIGKIDEIKIPGFARGGILPGYESRKRDTVLTPMRAGEGVLVPEVVKGIGAATVHALNAAGNRGGVAAVRALLHPGRAKGGLIHPMAGPYTVSSGYGPRADVGFHDGLDFAAPTGTRVLAAAAGRALAAGWGAGGAGNMVKLAHGGGLETLYYHLSRVAIRAGRQVRAGELIGNVGSTGNSTGPHLHFTVRQGGAHVNPASFLSGKLGTGDGGGGGFFNPFGKLIAWAKEKITAAFPQAGKFVDLAAATGTKLISSGIEWAKKKIASLTDWLRPDAGRRNTSAGPLAPLPGEAPWQASLSKDIRAARGLNVKPSPEVLRNWSMGDAVNTWDQLSSLRIRQGSTDPLATAQEMSMGTGILGRALEDGGILLNKDYLHHSSADRRATALHELGHVLGLPHTNRASIMQPVIRNHHNPTPFDTENLRRLYPTIYDGGGWLENYGGPQLIDHQARKPDAILTDGQWDTMRTIAANSATGGDTYHLHNVPMDHAEEVAQAIMFERRRVARGGKYSGARR